MGVAVCVVLGAVIWFNGVRFSTKFVVTDLCRLLSGCERPGPRRSSSPNTVEYDPK
jgi:hypothetical protein